jgi:hypothetical protein
MTTATFVAPQHRARRPACAAADQVRTGDQPQDRQGARPYCAASDSVARRRGDPTTASVAISLAATTPARPTGARARSPSVRPPEPWGPLPRSWVLGTDCPLWPWCHTGGRTTPTTRRQLGRPPSPRWATSGPTHCTKETCRRWAPERTLALSWMRSTPRLDANSLCVTKHE